MAPLSRPYVYLRILRSILFDEICNDCVSTVSHQHWFNRYVIQMVGNVHSSTHPGKFGRMLSQNGSMAVVRVLA